MDPSALSEEKAELRARMRALRDAIPGPERVRLSEMIAERFLELPLSRTAGCTLLFYSFGSEVQTAGIARSLVDLGHRILLPYLDDGEMHAAEYRPGDPLVSTAYGAREPARRVAVSPDQVELVLTPGLAFDGRGFRLGYGRGYFDRFLRRLPEGSSRVGVGFHRQLVERVPNGPDDERVGFVVTERETVVCAEPGP